MLYGTNTKLFTPLNDSTSTVGFSGELVPTGGKFLTTGAAADIWLVDAPDGDKRKYVLKAIRVSPGQLKRTQQQPTTFRSRVNQWEPLAHENLVRILGASQRLDLYTEYLSGGAASEYLVKHPNNSVALRKRMIGDVLAGLNYLHAQQPPVIHGSIRMAKLFVDSNGTTKIGEFGLADVVEMYSLFTPDISQDDPILARWSSPELSALEPRPRSTASDVWAAGCTLFEIISEKLPYCEHDYIFQVYHRILTNEMPGGSEDLLDLDFSQVWELATSCWEQIPEQRPSAHDLWKQHSFQTSVSPPLFSGSVHRTAQAGFPP
ncbi:unnamed protein product [Rhizoctonia solani]|uniref:Protein kinase domain-containing protein n=1 Tax=Rhizoctonia solani TaxID=456999 RepID=A0A8H3AZJ0_9AGAM|nr:unnamed protein product [Rhizoctonia solani]